VDFDAEPQLMVGYHKPNYPDPDAYVFSVIANILRDSGNSSRLYRRLVQTGIASDVAVYEELPGQRYPNLFVLHASPAAPHTTGEVEEILYSELDSLARVPVSEAELTKCKNQLEASYIREISDNNSLAQALARAQAIHGDWRVVTEHRANVSKVTADDVMRVARLYFKPQNRTVAAIVRENGQNNGRGREDQ
ncbi:MAG TPA: insulinase family protein, partial [Candidatus Latescibacteria bacterium]|nr:insulinase family protein [Candidatus Latescibacterota bacterium]